MFYTYIFRVSNNRRGTNVLQNEAFFERFQEVGRDNLTVNQQNYAFTNSERPQFLPAEFQSGVAFVFGPRSRPEVISHNDLAFTAESTNSVLEVTAPREFAITEILRTSSSRKSVLLYIYQHGDFGQVINIFVGVVKSHKYDGADKSVLTCMPMTAELAKPGLTEKFTRQCNHSLFSERCRLMNLMPGDEGRRYFFGFESTIKSVDPSGTVIEMDSDDLERMDDYYDAGYLLLPVNPADPQVGDDTMILKKEGAVLTVLQPLFDYQIGQVLYIFAGCNGSKQTCIEKFDNIENFAGFDVPDKDPVTEGLY